MSIHLISHGGRQRLVSGVTVLVIAATCWLVPSTAGAQTSSVVVARADLPFASVFEDVAEPVPQQVPQVPQPVPQPVPQQVPQPLPQPQAVPVPMPVPQVPPQVPAAQLPPGTGVVGAPVNSPHGIEPPPTQAGPQFVPCVPSPNTKRPKPMASGFIAIARPVPCVAEPLPNAPAAMVQVAADEPVTQSWSVGIVTSSPGRQAVVDLPSYRSPDGQLVQCLAGGFGWRYSVTPDGTLKLVGRLPVLRTTDAIVRDLPANHPMSPDCVVVVSRRLAP